MREMAGDERSAIDGERRKARGGMDPFEVGELRGFQPENGLGKVQRQPVTGHHEVPP